MAADNPNESARRQAQDLAYKAMDTRNPEEAMRFCARAIDMDPRCVNALVMMAGTLDDLDKRADHLSCVVRIAEEDLGGRSYLKENRGRFWGLLETRPYMRARTYLAETLSQAGKKEDAIAEYEALLDLNPQDNQGLRYVLTGLYLETGNLDDMQRLRDEYEDEASTVFAWSAVLESLIAGDIAGAEQALADARETNPHFEIYLLGRKPMPRTMSDYYDSSDEDEAIMCLDAIGKAWKKHHEAMRWLRKQEAPMGITASVKVGRNDPCPCGSGKRYKKCCLGREDAPPVAVGSPAAEVALNDIGQAMEGRHFFSQEELDSFLEETNRQRNRKPIGRFDGLSAEQVYRLVNFPFESPEVVQFPSLLSDPPSAPIAALFEMLADAVGEHGLKPTAVGNLPLKVVREIAFAYLGEEGCAEHILSRHIRSEENYPDLQATRIVAGLAGLVRRYKGKFILSRQCRKLLMDGGMQAIFPCCCGHTRRSSIGIPGLVSRDGPPSEFLCLHAIHAHRYGDQWREIHYEDAFLRAFPSLVDHVVDSTTHQSAETILRQYLSLRCLRRFAEFVGLVEIARGPEDLPVRVFKLRKTRLLGDAVRFHM